MRSPTMHRQIISCPIPCKKDFAKPSKPRDGVKVNSQLKDFIQGKPVSQQPQPTKQQTQTQASPSQSQSQQQQQNMDKLREMSQQKINSMNVTKTKTIPNPNNAILVSKPRTEEQPKNRKLSQINL